MSIKRGGGEMKEPLSSVKGERLFLNRQSTKFKVYAYPCIYTCTSKLKPKLTMLKSTCFSFN